MRAATTKRRMCGAVVAVVLVVGVPSASADVLVTRDATAGSYLRSDGQSDATTQACSTGRRSQNEPSVAVDPRNTGFVVSGSNDYCAQIVNGDVWVGYYRSTDGGATWQDSLVPAIPPTTPRPGSPRRRTARAGRPVTPPRPSTAADACSTASSASTAPSP